MQQIGQVFLAFTLEPVISVLILYYYCILHFSSSLTKRLGPTMVLNVKVVTICLSINFDIQCIFVFFLFRVKGFVLLMSHFDVAIEKAIQLQFS
jgi:hypothetical protein